MEKQTHPSLDKFCSYPFYFQENAQNLKAHTNMQQYVIDAGFDMDATAKYMESYYLRKYN